MHGLIKIRRLIDKESLMVSFAKLPSKLETCRNNKTQKDKTPQKAWLNMNNYFF
jgi:hypothetical protein